MALTSGMRLQEWSTVLLPELTIGTRRGAAGGVHVAGPRALRGPRHISSGRPPGRTALPARSPATRASARRTLADLAERHRRGRTLPSERCRRADDACRPGQGRSARPAMGPSARRACQAITAAAPPRPPVRLHLSHGVIPRLGWTRTEHPVLCMAAIASSWSSFHCSATSCAGRRRRTSLPGSQGDDEDCAVSVVHRLQWHVIGDLPCHRARTEDWRGTGGGRPSWTRGRTASGSVAAV